MPNGINYDLDFEKSIKCMGDRELLEFVSRQTLDQSKDISLIAKDVKLNKSRSLINRYVLIGLLILLVVLGILDPTVFHVWGL